MTFEAHLARTIIDRHIPRRACERQQRVAQHQRAKVQMRGRQRQCIQRRGICGIAQSIPRTPQDVAQGVAHVGVEAWRNHDLDHLPHQVALRRFRNQFD